MNVRDAALLAFVRAALMPRAIARNRISHVGEPQTLPFAFGPKPALAAAAAELQGQHRLFAVLVEADDVRAQFATMPAITASHLPLGEDRIIEDSVGGGGHGVRDR